LKGTLAGHSHRRQLLQLLVREKKKRVGLLVGFFLAINETSEKVAGNRVFDVIYCGTANSVIEEKEGYAIP
jgi:hypothetical protein